MSRGVCIRRERLIGQVESIEENLVTRLRLNRLVTQLLGRHIALHDGERTLLISLVRRKEEDPVPANRPADGAAILVVSKWTSCRQPALFRVQILGPEALNQAAVEIVRPGFADQVHVAAQLMA